MLLPLLDPARELSSRIRGEAALTMGLIGSAEAASALLNSVQNDPDLQVRWRAAQSLSRIGDPSVVPGLQETPETEEKPWVIEFIQNAISALGEPAS